MIRLGARLSDVRPYRRAFSLVELLVVLAIIGLLMALLLPALSQVRRRALVLVCPIAYMDQRGGVWICDPSGRHQLLVSPIRGYAGWVRWSPRGDHLAYADTTGKVVVVHVATRRTRIIEGVSEPTWIDDETLVGTRWFGWYNEMWKVSLRTGVAERWKPLRDMGVPYGQIAAQYEPHLLAPAAFLLSEPEVLWTPMADIVIRGKEWHKMKTVWEDPANNIVDYGPRVDWMGERVAWTRARQPGPVSAKYVAWKNLSDPSTRPPEILGAEFPSVSFCDWTPDGHLLVAITKHSGERTLAIMDILGRVRNEVPTENGLPPDNETDSAATWRRYERW